MKHLLLFGILCCAANVFAQKVILKDNLFNSSEKEKSIEVIENEDTISLKFGTSEAKELFEWNYELVVDAFKNEYSKTYGEQEIIVEAGRIFYKVQTNKILEGSKKHPPIAGSMGFEAKIIILEKTKKNPQDEYSDALKNALDFYKQDTVNNTKYMQFEIKDAKQIHDKFLESVNNKYYDEEYLKKHGKDNFEKLLSDPNKIEKDTFLTRHYKDYFQKIEIDSIEVVISQTFIETILVFGTIKDSNVQKGNQENNLQTHVTISNTYPIGISSINSIEVNLKNVKLYTSINGVRYNLKLSDVLSFYRPILECYRRDFSPADTSFTIIKNSELQKVTLFKTPSQKLFEFKVFSDFVGMDGTSPNGLVQVDFSKEMYLNSYRFLCHKNQTHSVYFGFLSYITPSFIISKFEKTNKYIDLLNIDSSKYITTLDLKQYELFSVGADFNLFMTTLPFLKSSLHIDNGFSFGRTGVADSTYSLNDSAITINEQGVNTFSYKAIARLVFQTDERYFFELRGNLNYSTLLNDNIYQVASLDNIEQDNPNRYKGLYSVELFAGYSPTSNIMGKLFFRYRYTGSFAKNTKLGFSQVQVGYSYYFNK